MDTEDGERQRCWSTSPSSSSRFVATGSVVGSLALPLVLSMSVSMMEGGRGSGALWRVTGGGGGGMCGGGSGG